MNDAEAFLLFHEDNPEVYRAVEEAARLHVNKLGIAPTSVDLLVHIARWEGVSATVSADGFKINNNYTPFYARLILRRHPEWDGLFRLRESDADFGDWLDRAA
jgi:hypothetical protein